MRHVAFAVAIVLQFTNPFTATVNAQAAADGSEPGQTASTDTAIEGRELGEHVAGMAPEHPLLHGVLFGDCVSELAITGECPHDDE